MSKTKHTGGPDCPACDEDTDIEIALGVLEACVDSDMAFKEDVRFRLIALLAQIEGLTPPPVLIAVDPEEDGPETTRPTGDPSSMSN